MFEAFNMGIGIGILSNHALNCCYFCVNCQLQKLIVQPTSVDAVGSNRDTRSAGVRHVCDVLSRLNWKTESVMEGRNELHVARRCGRKLVLKIRALTGVAPVPFPQGLDILDRIDYLVICNNLQGWPNLIAMKPQTVREVIHKDTKNDAAYWLQHQHYNKHGLDFEREFGDAGHSVFLDVHCEGMKNFLEDFGWKVETMTEIYGSSEEGRRDDNAMKYAQENKCSVIITQDKKLIKRLENKKHDVIGTDMANLAVLINDILKNNLGRRPE